MFFKKTWPDFTKKDFLKAISEFKVEREDLAGINYLNKNNIFSKKIFI